MFTPFQFPVNLHRIYKGHLDIPIVVLVYFHLSLETPIIILVARFRHLQQLVWIDPYKLAILSRGVYHKWKFNPL